MTSGDNNFNDFLEIVQPEKSQPEQRRLVFFSSVAVGLFLEWAQCCSINSTHLDPALVSYLVTKLTTTAHYSCPDNAIGLVAQSELSGYVKSGYTAFGAVGRKFSQRPGNPATVGVVRWPSAGDTAGYT